jgi:[ribosomal protein S18]-alanine N-acetyltransferase
MFYRLYKPEDFDELYSIEETCFVPPFRFSRSYMRQVVTSADSATWIAEEDGAIAGFAVVEWSSASSSRAAYIQTIEVLPAHRRSGVARELLCGLVESATRIGADTIWLHVDADNAAAIRLYESHGFELKGREENYYPRGRAALVYSKPLP